MSDVSVRNLSFGYDENLVFEGINLEYDCYHRPKRRRQKHAFKAVARAKQAKWRDDRSIWPGAR